MSELVAQIEPKANALLCRSTCFGWAENYGDSIQTVFREHHHPFGPQSEAHEDMIVLLPLQRQTVFTRNGVELGMASEPHFDLRA
jgi:hypothetical protein